MIKRPVPENGETAGGGGSSGATISVIAAASTMRKRAGTNLAPKIGATIRQAPMRRNGQSQAAIQASICPVVISMGR